MRETTRAVIRHGTIWAAVAAALSADLSALAQMTQRQLDPNQRQVVLVRQDTSDCSGSDVANVDSPLVGGTLWATQLFDGNTSVVCFFIVITIACTVYPPLMALRTHWGIFPIV
jgi:hypothetical protein